MGARVTAITSYGELLATLEGLPPPAPGHIRVFRGQNRDFGAMKPTALRGIRDAEQVWRFYSHQLANALAPDASTQDLDLVMLWLRAIKQHYGPGTEFLDVTHSPGIAAWFALHAVEYETAEVAYGPPGPFNPHTDVIGVHHLVKHVPYEQPAVLYVIDALVGSTSGDLEHGRVFDLAQAPEPFSTSPRITAQQGCLVYADRNVDHGDLASFYVPGTPLRIGRPLDGCAEVTALPSGIFPDVAADEWYRRFVSIPLAPALEKSQSATVYDHPINVSLYLPQTASHELDHASLDNLTQRFVVQRPPLLYASLLASGGPDVTQIPALADRFTTATPFLIEGPMMTTIAPVERLNLGVLMTDRAASAPRWDVVTGANVEDADLTNVFIDLSSLDAVGWERSEGDPDFGTIRAMWVVSTDHLSFYLTVFMQSPHELSTIGPVEVFFHLVRRDLVMPAAGAPDDCVALREFADLHRALLKALMLVRTLSPLWKLSANAQFELRSGDTDRVTSHARIEWALGRIVSLRSLAEPLHLYNALRMWDAPEPYYGDVAMGSPTVDGGIRTEGQPFADIPVEELLQPQTQQQIAAKTLPPLQGISVSVAPTTLGS
jgi:hypothetical protein